MPETGDKAVYEGERNELGVWHGFGKLRTKAYTYEGSFKDGQASGFGRCDYTDGEIYIGEYQESQKHGIGLLNINGDIFLGQFKNGKRHGPFSVIMNGYLAHPTYRDGIHVGHNASLDDSYRGERNEKCQRHGKGAAIFKSGDMYVGEFSEDKMQGSGALFFHTLKGVYMGEMQDNLMHGQGKFISPEGVVRIGTWEHGLKRMTRRFALEPATSAEEEDARWDEFKSERELPTYSEFISYQYQSVLSVLYHRICCVPGCLQTRLFAKFWAAVWVWYGLGNFSAYSRSVWFQIASNYWLFTVSACGLWTTKARLLYSVDECLQATKTHCAGDSVEHDASDRWTRYSRAWASIIAPRCILFMIVPWFTPVMLYSTTMATTPLYIVDPEVPLPPWLDFSSFYRRALRDSSGEEQEWIAVLDMIYLFATESRFVQTILNAYKFALSVALWQAGYHKQDLAVKYWVFSALFVFLPYCYVLALKPITYLGKTLGIKNSDLFFRSNTLSASASPTPSVPSSSPSPSLPPKAPPAHIPAPAPRRQSAVVSFGAVYGEHDGDVEGALELNPLGHTRGQGALSISIVESPLKRLGPSQTNI